MPDRFEIDEIMARVRREAALATARAEADQAMVPAGAGATQADLVASAMADPGGYQRFGGPMGQPEREGFWQDWEQRRPKGPTWGEVIHAGEPPPAPPAGPAESYEEEQARWAGTQPRFPANEPYQGTFEERMFSRLPFGSVEQPAPSIDFITGERMAQPDQPDMGSWDDRLAATLINELTGMPERLARGVLGWTQVGPGSREDLPPGMEAAVNPPAEPVTPVPLPIPEAQTFGQKAAETPAQLAGFIIDMLVARRLLPAAIPPRTRELMVWELVEQGRGGVPGQGALMGGALGGIQALPGKGLAAQAGKAGLESGLFAGITAGAGGEPDDVTLAALLPLALRAYHGAVRRGAPAVPTLEEFARRQTAEEQASLPERPVPGAFSGGKPLPSESGLPGVDRPGSRPPVTTPPEPGSVAPASPDVSVPPSPVKPASQMPARAPEGGLKPGQQFTTAGGTYTVLGVVPGKGGEKAVRVRRDADGTEFTVKGRRSADLSRRIAEQEQQNAQQIGQTTPGDAGRGPRQVEPRYPQEGGEGVPVRRPEGGQAPAAQAPEPVGGGSGPAERAFNAYQQQNKLRPPPGERKNTLAWRRYDALTESDTEYQRLKSAMQSERQQSGRQISEQFRTEQEAKVAAGDVTRETIQYAPLHLLPEPVRTSIQTEAARLRDLTPSKSVKSALQKIIDDAGRDKGAEVEKQKDRIVGILSGEQTVKVTGEQAEGQFQRYQTEQYGPPDPLVDAFVHPKRQGLIRDALASLDAGEPDMLARRTVDRFSGPTAEADARELLGSLLGETPGPRKPASQMPARIEEPQAAASSPLEAHMQKGAARVKAAAAAAAKQSAQVPSPELIARAEAVGINPAGRPAYVLEPMVVRAEAKAKQKPPGRFLRPGTIGGPAPQGPRERLAKEGGSFEPKREPNPEMIKQFEGSTPESQKEAKEMTQAYAAAGAAEDGIAIKIHDKFFRSGEPQTRQAVAEVTRQAFEWRRGQETQQYRELERILQHDPTPTGQRIRTQAARTWARLRKGEYRQAITEAGRVLERVTPAERKELIYYIERTGNPTVTGDTYETLSARLSTPAKAAGRRVSRWLEENRKAMAAYYWDPKYRHEYVTHMYKVKKGPGYQPRGSIDEIEERAFERAYKAIAKLHALQGTPDPPIPAKGTPQYAKFQEHNPWRMKRWHDTYEEALIQEGLEPRYPDLLTLLRKRQEVEVRNLTNVFLHKKLADVRTADGLPVILPRSLAPAGWREITHPAFRNRTVRPTIDPETGEAIIENGKPKTEIVWETSMVHPDAYWSLAGLLQPPIGAHAATKWGSWSVGKAEAANAIQKALRLSASFFHPFALVESGLAGGRIRLFKAMQDGVKIARNPGNAREMAEHGLQVGPSSDAEVGHFNSALQSFERLASKTPLAGKLLGGGVRVAQTGKTGFDKALWDYMHTGLKAEAWYRHTALELDRAATRAKKSGEKLTDDDIRTIKRETAKHVNAAFGGLNWEEMFSVAGRPKKILRWIMLAPDWTYSNLLIATDAFRGLPAKGKALLKGDLGGAWEAGDVRGRLARRYWLHMAKAATVITVAANYLYSGHGPWDNEIGHRFDIELPDRDEKGHKQYAKPFKQAREVARLMAVGTSLWNPREYFLRKASPLLDAAIRQGLGDPDYPEEWQVLEAEGKNFLQQIPARIKSFGQANIPYTLQGGQQFAYAIPVAKGMTAYKASQQLRNAYLNEEPGPGRNALVREILKAAKENDPKNEWWSAAHGNAVGDARQKWYREIAIGLDKDQSPKKVQAIVKQVLSVKGRDWDEAQMWKSVANRIREDTLADKDRIRRILGKVPEAFWERRPNKRKSIEQEMRQRTGAVYLPTGS